MSIGSTSKDLSDREVVWVTRAGRKGWCATSWSGGRGAPKGEKILADEWVALSNGSFPHAGSARWWRWTGREQEMVFLTNELRWAASTR
ncbi:MAG: hypothetical protein KF791_13000 [Verrucomicrobiae bacterium]|nr:hypothetical protein [Verrucomicrobiae bacterium]